MVASPSTMWPLSAAESMTSCAMYLFAVVRVRELEPSVRSESPDDLEMATVTVALGSVARATLYVASLPSGSDSEVSDSVRPGELLSLSMAATSAVTPP